MYRVLFAEDEMLVRLGMKNSIPWDEFDMELTAEADNGEDAYELFLKIRPDLVITDVRMDKMDGYELIQKIRAVDEECAILVVTCLDDFETIRKMIPYHIMGYILKASMNMDEIFEALNKVREYLIKIGRIGVNEKKEKLQPEEQIKEFLAGKTERLLWPGENRMKEMMIFSLEEEEQQKINELAMKLIRELIERQISDSILIETGDKGLCLFSEKQVEDFGRVSELMIRSIETFLGVHYKIKEGKRNKDENLKDWYYRLQRKSEDHIETIKCDKLIKDAVEYMHKNHEQSLTLNEISKIMGISPSYFSHLFKKVTEKNYIEYLNDIRLQEVKAELLVSDQNISVIAENHGFHNLEYFSRYFKKAVGISPAKWRQQNR